MKPNDPNLYHSLGVVFTKLNNFEKAIELYSKSQELNTKNPLTFYNLGYLLAKNLKFDESIKNYNRALKLDSNNPKFENSETEDLA